MWVVILHGDDEYHLLPAHDERGHICDKHCQCGPWLDDGIWIHNAADGREQHEHEIKH